LAIIEEPGFVPMQIEDLEEVLRIEIDSFEDPWNREYFVHEVLENRHSRCFCLRNPGQMVLGFACTWVVGKELLIHNFAIRRDRRGKGLGSRLLESVLDFGLGAGCRVAQLHVRPSNRPAVGLYRRAGFRTVGIRREYYGVGQEDAWVLEKPLRRSTEKGGEYPS